jgi:hypothetical protein
MPDNERSGTSARGYPPERRKQERKQRTGPPPEREKKARKPPGERGSQPDSAAPTDAGRRSPQAHQRPEDDERHEKRRQLDEAEKHWDEE